MKQLKILCFFLGLLSWGHAQDSTSLGPTGRSLHATAYDKVNGMMLVYGGQRHYKNKVPAPLDSKLWGWDGTHWTVISETGPPLRDDAKMVYHDRNKKCYLYGGRVGQNVVDEFWEWDGKSWTQLPKPAPGKRLHTNIIYDPDRNKIVLFGGIAPDSPVKPPFKNDIWEWDGNGWKEVKATGAPSPRMAFSMVYSQAFRRTLIVGGVNEKDQHFQEIWSWDGNKFELLSKDLPKVETGQGNVVSMDTRTKPNLLLFGRERESEDSVANGVTWLWNGVNWENLPRQKSPSVREFHTMVYDSKNGRAILFGGNGREEQDFNNPNDVWVFDGKWKKVFDGK